MAAAASFYARTRTGQGADGAGEQAGGLWRDDLPKVLAPHRHRGQQIVRSHEGARGQIGVPAEVFGRGVHDKVCALGEGVLVDRGSEGVVYDRQSPGGACLTRGDGDVEPSQGRVRRRLEEHDPRPVVQDLGQAADLVGAQKRGGDADLGKVVAEEFDGAAVDIADAHDVLPASVWARNVPASAAVPEENANACPALSSSASSASTGWWG